MKVEILKHITINKQHQNLKIVGQNNVGQKVTKYSEGDEKMFKQEIIIRMKNKIFRILTESEISEKANPNPNIIPQDTIIPSRLISLAGAKKSDGAVV